jgi:uncharacterized membrane protein YqiK
MIFEVNRDVCDVIARCGASPPICFGRLAIAGFLTQFGRDQDRYFIGIVSEDTMNKHLKALAAEAEEGQLRHTRSFRS